MSGLDPQANAMAFSLRERWVRSRPVLYHGTRYSKAILASGVLKIAPFGDCCVSLTRRPEVATYVAMSDRDDDEGFGAVFILDRRSLSGRYAIDIRHCGCWDGCGHGPSPRMFDEAEEAIWRDITDLHRHLVDVVRIDATLDVVTGIAA